VCCSVLQCVAMCCSVLQCVAMCCSVLQCVAACCTADMCDMSPGVGFKVHTVCAERPTWPTHLAILRFCDVLICQNRITIPKSARFWDFYSIF